MAMLELCSFQTERMAHGWRGGRLIPKTFQQWLMHIMGSQRIVARSSSLFVCHPNLRTCTHYSTASPIHHFVCTVVRKNPNCSWKKAFTLIPGCRFMSSGSKQINNNISLEDGMLQRYVESLVTQYTEAEQALLNSTDSISRSENTQRVYRLGSIVREYRMYITKRTEMEELDAIITGMYVIIQCDFYQLVLQCSLQAVLLCESYILSSTDAISMVCLRHCGVTHNTGTNFMMWKVEQLMLVNLEQGFSTSGSRPHLGSPIDFRGVARLSTNLLKNDGIFKY